MGNFKPNNKGLKKLRQSDPGLAADLSRRAKRMASACGEGYVGGVDMGTRGRMRGYVVTVTNHAKRSNLKHNTLVSHADSLR